MSILTKVWGYVKAAKAYLTAKVKALLAKTHQ